MAVSPETGLDRLGSAPRGLGVVEQFSFSPIYQSKNGAVFNCLSSDLKEPQNAPQRNNSLLNGNH